MPRPILCRHSNQRRFCHHGGDSKAAFCLQQWRVGSHAMTLAKRRIIVIGGCEFSESSDFFFLIIVFFSFHYFSSRKIIHLLTTSG
jgi:hypothetical protein